LASLAVGLGLGHQRSPRVRCRVRVIVGTMIHVGMFTMPFHHPARDYTTILDEDQEAILLADRLGFTEVFVGEHFSSWSERITSPLIFLATLINRTERIKFGTGVINMPQMHPATVAAHVARPFQQPHPPIAISLLTPNSASARTAGERGWIPVSGNFFHRRYLRGHWERYVEGCEAVGRRPDPDVWRVSRSVLVTETDSEAEDYLADPDSGLSFYYSFFLFSFSRLRKALFMVKPDQAMPDEAVTVDAIK